MLTEQQILKEFHDAEAILSGHFILSSGLHSDTYLQCARVLMNPQRAGRLCAELAARVKAIHGQIDIVVSPAMGGVVVGYELARHLNVDAVFCERENGAFTLRRGFSIAEGAKVLVVEDVVTTGKSSKETFECIRQYGAEVIGEAALIDRSGEKYESGNHPFLGVPLSSLLKLTIPTYTEESLPDALKNKPATKPGSRFVKA